MLLFAPVTLGMRPVLNHAQPGCIVGSSPGFGRSTVYTPSGYVMLILTYGYTMQQDFQSMSGIVYRRNDEILKGLVAGTISYIMYIKQCTCNSVI